MNNNKYKILLVEDEANIQTFVGALLEANGYQVIAAHTCAEAETLYASHMPDLVILDPPRKGSTNELIDALAARDIRRVVYISCDADTLARDCVRFREDGYEIGTVTPVDMFPRTGHVENVVCLTKKL